MVELGKHLGILGWHRVACWAAGSPINFTGFQGRFISAFWCLLGAIFRWSMFKLPQGKALMMFQLRLHSNVFLGSEIRKGESNQNVFVSSNLLCKKESTTRISWEPFWEAASYEFCLLEHNILRGRTTSSWGCDIICPDFSSLTNQPTSFGVA